MIGINEIIWFAKDIYTEDKYSWVYADEFAWYLEQIAEKFPELGWEIFNNVENTDDWEVFYQIFTDVLKVDERYYYPVCIEQFGSDWVSYEDYIGWVKHYVEKTITLKNFLDL